MSDKQLLLVRRRADVDHDAFLAGVLEHAALLAEHRDDVGTVAVDEVLPDQSPLAAVGMTVRDVTHHAVLRVWVDGAPRWRLPHSEQLVTGRVLDVADDVTGWLVDQRVAWDYDRDWRDGTPTPGVKQLSLVARLGSLDADGFRTRYHAHADVARVHHIGVWRYVQNIVRAPAIAGAAAGVHGMSELWFRHVDDMLERMYTHPDSPAAVRADTTGFIDFANTRSFLVREHCVRTA